MSKLESLQTPERGRSPTPRGKKMAAAEDVVKSVILREIALSFSTSIMTPSRNNKLARLTGAVSFYLNAFMCSLLLYISMFL